MKRNKVVFYIVIFCMALIIVAIVTSVMLPHMLFINEFQLSDYQNQLLYIRPFESRKLNKYNDKNSASINLELEGYFGEQVEIVDSCVHNGVLYIDAVSIGENGKKRLIIKNSPNGISKFLCDADGNIIANYNNEKINNYIISFGQGEIGHESSDVILDPFQNETFIFHDKECGMDLTETLENYNNPIKIRVFESVINPTMLSGKYFIFPAGTDVICMALVAHTSISNIFEWVPQNLFVETGVLQSEVKLFYEKNLGFRYGREVEFTFSDNDTRKIIEEWEKGEANVSLNKKKIISLGDNCFELQLTNMPKGMSLCDEFYKEKAIERYLSEK